MLAGLIENVQNNLHVSLDFTKVSTPLYNLLIVDCFWILNPLKASLKWTCFLKKFSELIFPMFFAAIICCRLIFSTETLGKQLSWKKVRREGKFTLSRENVNSIKLVKNCILNEQLSSREDWGEDCSIFS